LPSFPQATGRKRSVSEVSEGSRPSAGFTLLELLLVLFVLSLAGVIVFPSLQPLLSRAGVESTARKAASFLDDVRRQAVQSGRVFEVRFDDEGGRLVARPEGASDGAGDGEVVAGERAFPGLPGESSLEPETVRYYPHGSSSGGVLTFRRGETEMFRVVIGSFTGLARLEEAGKGRGGP